MASDITSIRVPKSVKDELNEVALEKEPYHATIQRLINENKQLKETNRNYAKLINMYEEKEMKSVFARITEFCNKGSDETTCYMVIMKIATDLVPTEYERTCKLCENAFIQQLVIDGKENIVFDASELVKEQIRIGDEDYYNQIDIIDEFLMILKQQIKDGVYSGDNDGEC